MPQSPSERSTLTPSSAFPLFFGIIVVLVLAILLGALFAGCRYAAYSLRSESPRLDAPKVNMFVGPDSTPAQQDKIAGSPQSMNEASGKMVQPTN